MANRNDVFSRFVNWLSASGRDGAAINRQGGSPDLFSRLTVSYTHLTLPTNREV